MNEINVARSSMPSFEEYCGEIRAFAEQAAEAGGCKVVFDLPGDMESRGYSRVSRQVLSTEKLEAIGWKGSYPENYRIKDSVEIMQNIFIKVG